MALCTSSALPMAWKWQSSYTKQMHDYKVSMRSTILCGCAESCCCILAAADMSVRPVVPCREPCMMSSTIFREIANKQIKDNRKMPSNGIINVYKEKGYTSHDVVAKLRGILEQKKIGHTGTLDPAAEGVLPVCLGKATKVCDMLTDKDKTYRAVCILAWKLIRRI